MSWLVSLIIAGMMFTSESNLPIQTNSNYIETNSTQIVRLDETEKFEQTYPLNANGRVSVSNINGSITIEAWDRNEVKLTAIKTADTRENLADVQIKVDARQDYLSVETDYDSWKRNNGGAWKNKIYKKLEVEFRLMVPRGAVLNEIEAVNGSINVSNMTNVTKVSAVNGDVRATNLRGTANLSTVNGTVEADFSTLQSGSQIMLETVNGRANLLLPSDANATIKADSVNGEIANDFGLPVRKGQYVGRNLHGRVGNGDVKIKLESVNGQLAVRRKQDGKTPNPATNLLNMNAKDDDDFDTDVEISSKDKMKIKNRTVRVPSVAPVVVNVPEINVDVQRELARAQKDMEKLKELRELNKIQVKIDQKQLNEQIRQTMEMQRGVMAGLRENAWFSDSPSIEKKSDSFTVKGVPRVTVDAKNCSVIVRGWDKSEVQYSMTKYSRSNSQKQIDATVNHTDSEVTITVPDDGTDSGTRVRRDVTRMRIEVYVPKKSNLRILTNREIRLENVSGELDLQGGAEAVNVRDVDGKLSIETEDGRIRVIGFRGEFEGKTADGLMNLEGDFKQFNAQTNDGTIVLTLPNNTNALLESDTEEIENNGFNFARDKADSNIWRIGNGSGITYRMNVGDGKIIVRNAGGINAN